MDNKKIDIKKIFFLPKDFFQKDKIVEKYKNQLNLFRHKFDQVEVINKDFEQEISLFIHICNQNITDTKIKQELKLYYLDFLVYYAQKKNCKETFQKIIENFEDENYKNYIFCKFPVEANIAYASALYLYYNRIKFDDPAYSKEKTEILYKAKYRFSKLYIQNIEKKINLNNRDLSQCIAFYAGCLADLSRWFEPIYLLNQAQKLLPNNPNIEYTQLATLEAIKDKTCLNYNGLLLLKIIESCDKVINNSNALNEQKNQSQLTKLDCLKILEANDLSIAKLNEQEAENNLEFSEYDKMTKFFIENNLYLNEHAYFCNCKNSVLDNIKIETEHNHTKSEWANNFNSLVDNLVYDFILARNSFYHSICDKEELEHMKKTNRSDEDYVHFQNSFLKNAFKSCYSILDQISFGIFQALGINYEKILKEKYPDKHYNIYFLNMWDYNLIENDKFLRNFYLISIQSISYDLNKSEYAALSEFKNIRNALEHRTLYITNDKIDSNNKEYYYRNELIEKTKILLYLTKSAIFSYIYFIRRESKILDVKE